MLFLCLVSYLSIDNQAFAVPSTNEESFDHYYDLAISTYKEDINQSIAYSLEAAEIAFAKKDVELVGRAHWVTGWLYRKKGDLVNAWNYYYGARKAYLRLKDWESVELLEENLGSVALDNKAYHLAIYRWEKRLDIAEKVSPERVAATHYDLGLAKKKHGMIVEAVQHQLEALKYYSLNYEADYAKKLARVHNEIGLLYLMLTGDATQYHADSAKNHFKKVLELDDSNLMTAMIHHNNGLADHYKSQYAAALVNYQKACSMHRLANRNRLLQSSLISIGGLYFDIQEPDSSMFYLSKGIDLELDEMGGVLSNDFVIRNELEYDFSDDFFRAVKLVDSIQAMHPRFLAESHYNDVIQKVAKIKLSTSFMEQMQSNALMELNDEEMKEESAQKQREADTRNLIVLVAVLLTAMLAGYKFFQTYQRKKAVNQSIRAQQRRSKRLFKDEE